MVNVQDRPISSVGGINGPQGVSMQRQVYDKNYYINKIKEKMIVIMRFNAGHSGRNIKSQKENITYKQRTKFV